MQLLIVMGEVMRIGNCFAATRRLRAALLTSSALALAWMLPATASHAQDATWLANPGSGDFDTGANWTPAAVPTGTAFFGTSSTTSLSFSQNPTTVGGWTFNAGASNYTFTNGNVLNFTGAGIVINGGSATITSNSILWFFNSSSAGSATITNNSAIEFFDSSTAGSAAITNWNLLNFHDTSTAGSASITNNVDMTFLNTSTAGNATITNNRNLTFQGSSTAGGAAITTIAGALVDFSSTSGPGNDHRISAGSIAGTGVYALGTNQLTVGSNNLSTEVSGAIGGVGGSLVKVGTGTLTLSGTNFYTGGTTVNSGLINFNTAGSFGTGAITLNGGALQWASGTSTDVSSRLAIGSNGGTLDTNGSNVSFGTGLLALAGDITKAGAGTLTFLAANSYLGATIVTGGTVRAGAANVFAANSLTTLNAGGTLDLGGFAQTIGTVSLAGGTIQNGSLTGAVNSSGGTINGLGGLLNLTTTAGTTIVTGTNSFIGSTTVNGGVLDVLGTLSDPTVNSGGTLTGTGSVGATQVNSGGIFAPGNGTPGTSMTVTGNLAFQSGAIYLVQVNPSTASFANVSGSATLGGATVNAVFANGSYVSKQYTILTAAGGVSGTFGSLAGTNLPSNFKTTLSYDASNAYLNLGLSFGATPPTPGSAPPSLSGNQQAVGNALSNFFNTTGGIPLVFGTLTEAGLTQASGESATGAQQTTFQAMSQFLGLLTDPFMGRGGGFGGATSPTGYADEGDQAGAYASNKKTDAFAMFTKAPLAKVYEPRWSVWAAGYGGSQSTSGNAATGSNDTTSRIAGTAVGADYLLSPNTLAGFAIAGGGTSFGVNNLGSGRSDLFQAGAYVRHTNGPAYITAALAYGWQDVITNRTLSIAGLDQLRAEFNANAYSGRVEGGYRFVAPVIGGIGITPYAAGQFTSFDLPAYAESVVSGTSNFALNYAAKSVTDSRSELGLRTDESFAVQNGVLTLRSRLAWAHDYNPSRAVGATFQALPGASFVVNGAAQASDSALTTASAEMKWTNGWSAAATFEGEFSDVTSSYAGKGVVRYAW